MPYKVSERADIKLNLQRRTARVKYIPIAVQLYPVLFSGMVKGSRRLFSVALGAIIYVPFIVLMLWIGISVEG